jgi:hypothetical protein
VTFNIALGNAQWELRSGNNTLLAFEPFVGIQTTITISYIVTGANNDTNLTDIYSTAKGNISIAATCVASPDTQNIRALQVSVSKTEAAISGDAITGAVGGAINDAFAPGGGAGPITFGPNGIAFNFGAEPKANVAGLENVYASAGNFYKAPQRVPLFASEWSMWADIRGTGFDRTDTAADLHGHQLNLTGGIGRKLTPDFLVGLVAGYENFLFTDNSIAGRMTGDGGTIGAYAGWRLAPHWRLDGMFGWSDINYGATAGAATGSFTGSRWLGSGGLTGDYQLWRAIFEPSLRIYALSEHEGAWTDSTGTLQDARTFSIGRASTGGKLSYPGPAAGDLRLAPYVGLYGDYRFSTDSALPVAAPYVGIKDGWSGRATAGISATGRNGATFSLGAELGGFGAGYDLWSVNGRVHVPF